MRTRVVFQELLCLFMHGDMACLICVRANLVFYVVHTLERYAWCQNRVI